MTCNLTDSYRRSNEVFTSFSSNIWIEVSDPVACTISNLAGFKLLYQNYEQCIFGFVSNFSSVAKQSLFSWNRTVTSRILIFLNFRISTPVLKIETFMSFSSIQQFPFRPSNQVQSSKILKCSLNYSYFVSSWWNF